MRRKLQDTEELLELIIRTVIRANLQAHLAKAEPLLRDVLGPIGAFPASPKLHANEGSASRLDQNEDEQMQAMARS